MTTNLAIGVREGPERCETMQAATIINLHVFRVQWADDLLLGVRKRTDGEELKDG
jgi:hypothetical protein